MTRSLDELARGARVLVTGATGYVAGYVVQRLLEAGAVVHAAVRDPANERKIAHLKAMADTAPGSIEFFKTDLLEPGSYDAAMQGCAVVFHTASPFLTPDKVEDPQRDLVTPALRGTENVLDSANRATSVTRVVVTSSGAAMSGGPEDVAKAGGVITEASWNTVSSLKDGPYLYSKTVAERRAWEMAEEQDRWRLVVVNPGLVLGRGTAQDQTSASFDYVRAMADGTFQNGLPPLTLGMVDVQDVAEAHFRAGFDPDAEGRHIVWAGDYPLGHIADILKARFGDRYPFPVDTALPEGAAPHPADNSKSKTKLGISYRALEPATIAMFEQLIETGRLPRR